MTELNPQTSTQQFLLELAHSRMIETGEGSLSEIELLAVLLHGSDEPAPHEHAAQLLMSFGSLRKLMTASRTALSAHNVSDIQYAKLKAAMELTRRHYQELMVSGPSLSNPRATREYVRMRLRDLPHEVFCCAYLDNRNRVIKFEELFRGTIDGASVHPREVVKASLAINAAAVILAHNHPSGVAEPSQADELITRRLKQALDLVDIRVLDHLIVADGVCESFAERGLL